MKILGVMGKDQYGNTFHELGKHPRQKLIDKLGGSRAEKMFCDTVDGKAKHIGYIVNTHWITLYNVCEWSKEA